MDPVPSREIADMSGQEALPRKNGELVFDEAWQGRIFGMTVAMSHEACFAWREFQAQLIAEDRKSTRLNSSHPSISYAVFCLKKKKKTYKQKIHIQKNKKQ